jgi:hypothetical protein
MMEGKVMTGYDPRRLGQEATQEEADMAGLTSKDRLQEAKRNAFRNKLNRIAAQQKVAKKKEKK